VLLKRAFTMHGKPISAAAARASASETGTCVLGVAIA
jgi:hypothetical protein